MKGGLLLVVATVFSLILCQAKPQSCCPQNETGSRVSQSENEWASAQFRNLTMGRSTKKDVLKSLGKPNWEGFPEGASGEDISPEWWMDYDGVSDLGSDGKLTVILDKKKAVVLGIVFYPQNLTKSDIINAFGREFVITKYAFEPCDEENGGSAQIYESKDGQLIFLEYRSKGIAVSFESPDSSKLRSVEYVSSPLGAKISKCKPEDGPKPQKQ